LFIGTFRLVVPPHDRDPVAFSVDYSLHVGDVFLLVDRKKCQVVFYDQFVQPPCGEDVVVNQPVPLRVEREAVVDFGFEGVSKPSVL